MSQVKHEGLGGANAFANLLGTPKGSGRFENERHWASRASEPDHGAELHRLSSGAQAGRLQGAGHLEAPVCCQEIFARGHVCCSSRLCQGEQPC